MKLGLAVAAGAIVLVIVAAFAGQRAMLFPAPRPPRTPAPELGQLVRLPSTVALWSPPPADGPVVVHFHGNGEQLADLRPVIAGLRARGLGVLAVEYPGYGVARGSPSETALVSAGREALVYAGETLGIAPGRLILQGQSLGSGVASQLAVRGSAAKLVLISPFTSVTDLASRMFPLLPAGWLVRDRFDTRQAASDVPIPVLIVHGDRDEIVPFSMGEDLAHAFPKARLVRIAGAHHNDLWIEHARELTEAIMTFAGPREAP
jgi:fermentation-respiration switch protein FrsA (DUF1100 family)